LAFGVWCLVFDVWFAAALAMTVSVSVTVVVTVAWARPQRHAAHCNMSNHSLHCTECGLALVACKLLAVSWL